MNLFLDLDGGGVGLALAGLPAVIVRMAARGQMNKTKFVCYGHLTLDHNDFESRIVGYPANLEINAPTPQSKP